MFASKFLRYTLAVLLFGFYAYIAFNSGVMAAIVVFLKRHSLNYLACDYVRWNIRRHDGGSDWRMHHILFLVCRKTHQRL